MNKRFVLLCDFCIRRPRKCLISIFANTKESLTFMLLVNGGTGTATTSLFKITTSPNNKKLLASQVVRSK